MHQIFWGKKNIFSYHFPFSKIAISGNRFPKRNTKPQEGSKEHPIASKEKVMGSNQIGFFLYVEGRQWLP